VTFFKFFPVTSSPQHASDFLKNAYTGYLQSPQNLVLKVLGGLNYSLLKFLGAKSLEVWTGHGLLPRRRVDAIGHFRSPSITRFPAGCVGSQVVEIDQQINSALHVIAVGQPRPVLLMHVTAAKVVLEVTPPDVGEDRLGGDNATASVAP
jgi:hypothetical protein